MALSNHTTDVPDTHRRTCLRWLLTGISASALPLAASPGGQRVALVVGIDHYDHMPKLSNAAKDADDVEKTLKQFGFEVSSHRNVQNRAQLENIVADFVARHTRKDAGEALWFYFAGHGISHDQENYAIPGNAPPAESGNAQVRAASMALGAILSQLQTLKFDHYCAVFDACRSKLSRGMVSTTDLRSPGTVLAPAQLFQNADNSAWSSFALVMTSAPGKEVMDGAFVTSFVEQLKKPGATWNTAIDNTKVLLKDRVALQAFNTSSFTLNTAALMPPASNSGLAFAIGAAAVAISVGVWWSQRQSGQHVEIVDANTGERLMHLSPGSKEVLGRRAKGLLSDTAVSSQHANVGLDSKGQFWIEDVSSNGTFHAANNEARLVSRRVYFYPQGQVLYLGHGGVAVRVQKCGVGKP